MSKELIGKIRDELSDGGVMVAPYWAELFKESAEALETQAREIERLQLTCNDLDGQNDRIYAELAALKAQPVGVVLPERKTWNQVTGREGFIETETHNACLDEVARLNSSPVSAGDDRETIRAVFLRNGFTIKEGQADLKPYVYAAADELMSIARAALSAPSHGEQVRHMVPSWMASARAFVDRLHLAGWRDHADAQHAGVAGMYDELLAAAPSAGSQEQGE